MRRLLRCVAVLTVIGAAAPAGAAAVVEQPFAPRYSANERGAIWITGSTSMTCPAAAPGCAAAQAGTATGATLNNNAFAMAGVDVDSDPATFNSSSSTFTPAAGSEVLFAGLYFGGRVTAGAGGGAPAPNAAARGAALLRTPASGAYVPVSGAVADSTAVPGAYVAVADVTALVRAGGFGRYFVANVQSGTGLDRFAGWALVVVYRDQSLPVRNLSVFDGLATIQQGDPPLAVGVSGFKTPLGGPVRTSVGLVAYEGDRGSSGDRLALNGQLLADAANPATNLFNSSVSFEGTDTLAQRLPPYVNGLGFDSDRIVADGVLGNGATSATLAASTTLDQYLIQVATFTTALSTPLLAVDKSVVDLNGGEVEPGDVLRYTVTTRNVGDDAATGVQVQDAVPAGTTLLSGSPSGGFVALAPGGSATVGFEAVVDPDALDGLVIANTASASGTGATAGRPVSAVSAEVTSIVKRPPVEASLTLTPATPTAGEPVAAELTVVNKSVEPVEDAVLSFSARGADVISAELPGGRRCAVADDVVRCPLGTLAPGEEATVRLRLRPRDRGVLRPRITLRGDGAEARRVTLKPVRVRKGQARVSIHKTARVAFARSGGVVRYRIIVAAAARAATAHDVRVCDLAGVGLRLRRGRACWRLGKLAPGEARKLSAVADVTVPDGVVRNTARARASNARGHLERRRPACAAARARGVAAAAPRARAAC